MPWRRADGVSNHPSDPDHAAQVMGATGYREPVARGVDLVHLKREGL